MGSGAPPGPGHGTWKALAPMAWIASLLAHTEPLFQVSVTAREDVPAFGPPLPSPPVFQKVRNSSFCSSHIQDTRFPSPNGSGWSGAQSGLWTLGGPLAGLGDLLDLLPWGLSPALLLEPAGPGTGRSVFPFAKGSIFISCCSPRSLGQNSPLVMEMPSWVWRVDFLGPGKLASGLAPYQVGLAWAKYDQRLEVAFQGSPRLSRALSDSLWHLLLLRPGESWGFSSVPGPRVQGVPAHQAHQRRERLLQVGQVCEARGEGEVSDGLPPVLWAACSPASVGGLFLEAV